MPNRINIYFSSRNEMEVFGKVKKYADENKISLSKAAFALIEKAFEAEGEAKGLTDLEEKLIKGFQIAFGKDPKMLEALGELFATPTKERERTGDIKSVDPHKGREKGK